MVLVVVVVAVVVAVMVLAVAVVAVEYRLSLGASARDRKKGKVGCSEDLKNVRRPEAAAQACNEVADKVAAQRPSPQGLGCRSHWGTSFSCSGFWEPGQVVGSLATFICGLDQTCGFLGTAGAGAGAPAMMSASPCSTSILQSS